MNELGLPGLDGSDPLGFLAALGVLRILDERFGDEPEARPRLAWRNEGFWRPVVGGVESVDRVLEAIQADLDRCARDPVLDLAYAKSPARRVDRSEDGAIEDLKPPPEVQSALYREVVDSVPRDGRRATRWLAAFGTEMATDHSGFIKPTALHFTAGQQQFLAMARQLREGVRPEDFRAALTAPIDPQSNLPSFSWSATGQRLYAYRAEDPSTDKRASCPGSEWLALRGTTFFSCVPALTPRGPVNRTTGVQGRWKHSALTWPLWEVPATARTVESLLRTPALADMAPATRAARGVTLVLQAEIMRTDQGGYGSFKPPRVV